MAGQKAPDPNQLLLRNFGPIVAIAVGFIAVGTVFYHYVENWTWLDSVYFTVVTLATVGYGDFVPTTNLGKVFTIFYILIGITIFIALARAIVIQIIMRRKTKLKKRFRK
jgi:voltage-gated potassium channel Kch